MTTKTHGDFAQFPDLALSEASLVPMEKSLLGHFILLNQPRLIVELGVYEAQTTLFMCRFLEANNIDCHVVGFDLPDVIARLQQDNAAVQAFEASGRLRLIPGRLPDSLDTWLESERPQIDFALVDALHEYTAVYGELTRLWPHLSEGAYVLCHDYSEKHAGVRYAVDHFARTHNAHIMPLACTQRGRDADYASVLAVVAKPVYAYRRQEQLQYASRQGRRNVRRRLAQSTLWQNVIKPVLKRK